MKRGPYEVTSSKIVYKNPWITLREDKVIKPGGGDGLYGVVDYSPGVSVVALNEKREIFLVKEYAYAIGEYNINLPTGGVEKGEKPLDAAIRELKEEAGVEADDWKELGYIHPYTMIVWGPMYLYMASNARVMSSNHEAGTELMTVPFPTAIEWVRESKINHAGSCVAILKAQELI